MNLEALYQRLKLLFQEGVLIVDTKDSNLATETTLQTIAKEETLQNIDNKIIKADTDNVIIVNEPAYDNTTDRLKVRVEEDTAGFAKEQTLQSIDNKIIKVDTDNVTIINEPAYDDTTDRLKVRIEEDTAGLAKEQTLQSIDSKITKVDTDNVTIVGEPAYEESTDRLKVKLEDETIGLAKDSTLQDINNKITTVDTDKISDKWSYMVNQGVAFEAGEILTIDGGSSKTILLANPSGSGKTLYIKNLAIVGYTEGRVERYVGVLGNDITINTNGTSIPIVNKDPSSSIGSVALLEYDGSYSNSSTRVVKGVIPGGSGLFAQGGHAALGLAGKLPEGFAYLITIYNDSSMSSNYSILLEWWEE